MGHGVVSLSRGGVCRAQVTLILDTIPSCRRPQDVFARGLYSWKVRVADNIKTNGVPEYEVLVAYTRDRVVPGIQATALRVPADVKQHVVDIMSAYGWDMVANAPTPGFSVHSLQAGLALLCRVFPIPEVGVGAASCCPPHPVVLRAGCRLRGCASLAL